MCVIIVKPAGVKMPKYQVLQAAYRANPHGCGFASANHHYKGLSFAKFMRELGRVKDDENCIIHFRLATHGSIKATNCHPFKRGNVFFAHNGILGIKPYKDMTDSETAFKDIFYPDIETFGLHSDELRYDVYNIIGGSKFAFLQGDDLVMFGDFIKGEDGCFYSNERFRYLLPYNFKIFQVS